MNRGVAIRCEGLGKRYRIGARERYLALRDVISRAIRRPFTLGSRPSQPDCENSIWALKGVDLEIRHGDVVGIVGRNGAGKSTLLKILSRITEPTEGAVTIRGRLGSLLEVGTGFHPELTGRENVYLNGAILGMTKAEIARKFDEIVAFAEVERFLDTPVKHYSSGMYVRLAFAVAAHLDPEILLVDEVLAVGDASFQKKCLGKMGDVARRGRTVLFVSHNLAAVQSLCTRAIELREGRIAGQGSAQEVVAAYLREGRLEVHERHWPQEQAPGNANARVLYAAVHERGRAAGHVRVDTPIDLVFRMLNLRHEHQLHFNLLVYNEQNVCVFNTASTREKRPGGVLEAACSIPAHLLNDGTYSVRFLVHYVNSDGIDVPDILSFEVHDVRDDDLGWYGEWVGVVRPRLTWQCHQVS